MHGRGGGRAFSAVPFRTSRSGGPLLDLIEECEYEEARRRSSRSGGASSSAGSARGGGGGSAASGASTAAEEGNADLVASAHTVEALVALVRREVRLAVDHELSSLRQAPVPFQGRGLRLRSSASTEEEHFDGSVIALDQAAPSPSASSCAGSRTPVSRQEAANPAAPAAETTEWFRDAEAQFAEHRQALAGLQEALSSQAAIWDRTWKGEAELRAAGDQEVAAQLAGKLSGRVDALEAQVEQVNASVGSLARLQVELGSEAKLRQDADGRLQAFLRDFREHIVGELEEARMKHMQLSARLEGAVQGLASRGLGGGARVAGPDELEVAFGESSPVRGCEGTPPRQRGGTAMMSLSMDGA